MRTNVSAAAGWFLVIVHVLLALWAAIGLAEMVFANLPWPRVSNPLFPVGVLLAQWLSILVASFFFIGGYLWRWRFTPFAMAGAYAVMATVCAVETFGYLVHDTRFLLMAIEYATYAAILLYLFKAPGMRLRFNVQSATMHEGPQASRSKGATRVGKLYNQFSDN